MLKQELSAGVDARHLLEVAAGVTTVGSTPFERIGEGDCRGEARSVLVVRKSHRLR
jgi:hypothetical protein